MRFLIANVLSFSAMNYLGIIFVGHKWESIHRFFTSTHYAGLWGIPLTLVLVKASGMVKKARRLQEKENKEKAA